MLRFFRQALAAHTQLAHIVLDFCAGELRIVSVKLLFSFSRSSTGADPGGISSVAFSARVPVSSGVPLLLVRRRKSLHPPVIAIDGAPLQRLGSRYDC